MLLVNHSLNMSVRTRIEAWIAHGMAGQRVIIKGMLA